MWGVRSADSGWLDTIVRVDLEMRTSEGWSQDGCFPGEPVFVATPGASDEDEGILLSVVFDSNEDTSFLLALDARTLDEIARAQAPHHIPYGFHGQYAA